MPDNNMNNSSGAVAPPIPPMQPAIPMADGFVVVHRWKAARDVHSGRCFDEYARLADAVAFFRTLGGGVWADHEPIGIYPAIGGLPIRDVGPLPMDVIDAVVPGRARHVGHRTWEPNTPENCRYREKRHAEEAVLLAAGVTR